MIDFIGDVHGHADELCQLLEKLGYEQANGAYGHPDRKVLFVGDYIDRGLQIRETVQIVKRMVDAGNAIALMGNHEYNALCFHHRHPAGGHLRPHLIKNIIQHYETLRQFQNKQDEYEEYLNWFMTLPLFYETDDFCAVHACWDQEHIDYLKNRLVDNRLNKELLHESANKETRLFSVIDETLKGKEIAMPGGLSFKDKDGTRRTKIRIKWWENPAEMTYKSISVIQLEDLPDTSIEIARPISYYSETGKNVFFGHYWLRGTPSIYKHNVCCLDYSVAKEGELVAYRWDGETELDNRKLIAVR